MEKKSFDDLSGNGKKHDCNLLQCRSSKLYDILQNCKTDEQFSGHLIENYD